MTMKPTWTRHTFRCQRCRRLTYTSVEAIAVARRDMDFGDASDAEVAAAFDFCLACVDGTPIAGEHVVPVRSPEETGVYRCPSCSNAAHFTGIDPYGVPGEDDHGGDCHNGMGPRGGELCDCRVELRQDFDVVAQDGTPAGVEIDYHSHSGGHGADIGDYARILCRACGAVVWTQEQGLDSSAAQQ